MELPYKARDINGREYKAYTLHLNKWAELTEFLSDVLGDPIASLLRGDAVVPEGTNPSLSKGDFTAMIGQLSKKINAKMIMRLANFMGNCLHVDNVPLGSNKQTTWWSLHMADLAPAVKLFLESQYSDFYEGLSDSIPARESVLIDQNERAKG
jgi:hypothetical protein